MTVIDTDTITYRPLRTGEKFMWYKALANNAKRLKFNATDLIVALSIANHSGETGKGSHPKVETIAANTGVSVSAVNASLRKIKTCGLIVVVKSGQGRGPSDYELRMPNLPDSVALSEETKSETYSIQQVKPTESDRLNLLDPVDTTDQLPDPGTDPLSPLYADAVAATEKTAGDKKEPPSSLPVVDDDITNHPDYQKEYERALSQLYYINPDRVDAEVKAREIAEREIRKSIKAKADEEALWESMPEIVSDEMCEIARSKNIRLHSDPLLERALNDPNVNFPGPWLKAALIKEPVRPKVIAGGKWQE